MPFKKSKASISSAEPKVITSELSFWNNLTLEQKGAVLSHYLNTLKKKKRKEIFDKLKNEIDYFSDYQVEDFPSIHDEKVFDYMWEQMTLEAKQSLFESGVGGCVLVKLHGAEEKFYQTQILNPGIYRKKVQIKDDK